MSKAGRLFTDDSIFLFDSLPRELYYFAYGSNMNGLQMLKRCSRPKVVTVARLPNYRVGFFGYSRTWDGAQESLVYEPGHDVWGVVYELSNQNLESLDAWQDVRMDGTGAYFHYPARVHGVDARTYTILFYKKDIQGEPKKASKPYLDFIVSGAEEKQLPAEYVGELRAIESSPATYPVPRPRAFNPESLLAWDCSTCSG
jgi:gamma-glutamylcyclotransferase (GGCT)/AIG2-like uncharacterized protein YtfP